MSYITRLVSIALLFISTNLAFAHDTSVADIRIVHPFATPTAPSANVGAVYLDIDNQGDAAARLIAARTPRAEVTELHNMTMDNGTMRMFKVDAITVPAGETLKMRPKQGYHIMLINLEKPLIKDEKFPLWLSFEGHDEVKVNVWVEEAGSDNADHHHHH